MINIERAIKIISRRRGLTTEELKKKLGETSEFLFNHGLIIPQVVQRKGNKPITVYHLRWIN